MEFFLTKRIHFGTFQGSDIVTASFNSKEKLFPSSSELVSSDKVSCISVTEFSVTNVADKAITEIIIIMLTPTTILFFKIYYVNFYLFKHSNN